MWLLKSTLDQNPRVIYQKFNGDFKSHINFGGTKREQGDDVYHYSLPRNNTYSIYHTLCSSGYIDMEHKHQASNDIYRTVGSP
jgi:hypothetical protein